MMMMMMMMKVVEVKMVVKVAASIAYVGWRTWEATWDPHAAWGGGTKGPGHANPQSKTSLIPLFFFFFPQPRTES